jgi:hypothetical protein
MGTDKGHNSFFQYPKVRGRVIKLVASNEAFECEIRNLETLTGKSQEQKRAGR